MVGTTTREPPRGFVLDNANTLKHISNCQSGKTAVHNPYKVFMGILVDERLLPTGEGEVEFIQWLYDRGMGIEYGTNCGAFAIYDKLCMIETGVAAQGFCKVPVETAGWTDTKSRAVLEELKAMDPDVWVHLENIGDVSVGLFTIEVQ